MALLSMHGSILSVQGQSLFAPGLPKALVALAALASGRKRLLRLPAVTKRHSTPLAVRYLHAASARDACTDCINLHLDLEALQYTQCIRNACYK